MLEWKPDEADKENLISFTGSLVNTNDLPSRIMSLTLSPSRNPGCGIKFVGTFIKGAVEV